ncbi:hypothetical protein GF378_01245 [Candidatus Pacearchaeota archaeon]|nr:hypothetical protein [Candidatus Pacearchaeota archaeon]
MDVKVIKSEKGEAEIEVGSVTIAEVLRVYLNKDSSVDLAVWKREHPTKNPVLLVKAKKPKKAVKDAVDAITKDLDKASKEFKDLK